MDAEGDDDPDFAEEEEEDTNPYCFCHKPSFGHVRFYFEVFLCHLPIGATSAVESFALLKWGSASPPTPVMRVLSRVLLSVRP
jgi:hypothetical protein